MSTDSSYFETLYNLVKRAPENWLRQACDVLLNAPEATGSAAIIQSIPASHNGEISRAITELIQRTAGNRSWEALGFGLQAAAETYARVGRGREVELLWTGPSPDPQIPARRIDQALYDLLSSAKREIILVTFAASRISRLSQVLLDKVSKGVRVRLVLEFEQTSEGQLSYDALRAFPPGLVSRVEVYCWPLEHRERNQQGRPAKLHAKLALVDGVALVSSANLTDDAFVRNFEMGVQIGNREITDRLYRYIEEKIQSGEFQAIETG